MPENDTLSDTSVFENVLIAKITTNGSGMTANTIYPVGNSYLDKIYTKPLDSYPVGSIYMNVNPTDPATIFGGLLEQLPPGRVLIGQGMSDYGVNFNNGSTGGEYSHTLSQQELPSFNISGNTSRVDLVGKWSSTTSGNASVFGQYGKDGFGIVKIESHYGKLHALVIAQLLVEIS